MTVQIDLIVAGQTHAASGGNPWHYITLTGNGVGPVQRHEESRPQRHGSTDLGFTVTKRYLNLALMCRGATLAAVDGYRDDLEAILTPSVSTPILFRITRDNGTVRQINVHMEGLTPFDHTFEDRLGASQKTVVRFGCPDPIFYDPVLKQFLMIISGSGLAVPTPVPTTFDLLGTANIAETLTYNGTFPEYPTILIAGPITDPVLTNVSTGKVLDFTGTTISDGEAYTITLNPDEKGIESDVDGDRIQDLTDDSDFNTWALVGAPEVANGENSIRLQGSSVGANTLAIISYYERYIAG